MPENQIQQKAKFSLNTKLVSILALVTLAIYANTFNNGYVLDDFSAIAKNTIVTKGLSAIPEIFTTPYLHGFTISPNDLYRPLSLAMFAIEYQVFGSPFGSHVINVIFFSGCVILLFLFLNALFKKKKPSIAFLTSLLFALHPIHTEVVANIKSRDELLCFFFAFLSLHLFIKYSDTGKLTRMALGAFSFFLSLLSKETSITFIFIMPFIFFFYRNENKTRSAYITLSTAAIAIVFLSIRFSVLSAFHANNTFQFSIQDNYLICAPSLLVRLATSILILGKYLRLLFVPYPLICDYGYNTLPFVSFSNFWVLISLIAYLIILSVGIYRLVRFRKDPIAFAIIFFLITVSLFSNIFFLIGAAMAERFLFFPSVGWCMICALVIEKLALRSARGIYGLVSRKAFAIIISLFLIFGLLTINRNSLWKNAYMLYKNDSRYAPHDYRIFFYLGSTLIASSVEETDTTKRNKLLEEGIGNLKKSLSIYPGFNIPNSEIGLSYTNLFQFDSAERYDLRALDLNPQDTFTRNNLAAVYFKQGKYRRSIEMYQENIKLDPGYARDYRNMGGCYLKMGIYDSAIIVLKKAILFQPNAISAYRYLSIAYKQSGSLDSAKKYEALSQQNSYPN